MNNVLSLAQDFATAVAPTIGAGIGLWIAPKIGIEFSDLSAAAVLVGTNVAANFSNIRKNRLVFGN